jgi:putative chitinase
MNALQFQKATGLSQTAAAKWVGPVSAVMALYAIDSAARQAAFLAQIGHESGGFVFVAENLNYSADGLANTWPAKFSTGQKTAAGRFIPNGLANTIARNPEAIANAAYANRLGNGDEKSGDGWRFRGRGLIQITGRDNYKAITHDVGLDYVLSPDLLEQPSGAAQSAAWFWNKNALNQYADSGDFDTLTRRINGGLNGIEDRRARWSAAKIALGV